jgi:hypothetical protein
MIKKSIRKLTKRRTFFLLFLFMILTATPAAFGGNVPPCAGTLNVCRFRLLVEPTDGAAPLPVQSINILQAGQKLRYEPLHLPPAIRDSAKIALIVVATHTGKELIPDQADGQDEPAETTARLNSEIKEARQVVHVLESYPAKDIQHWTLPARTAVVGIVFGPHGLDTKRISSMVVKNPDLIPQLTNYAEETTKVGALVEVLSEYQQQSDPSRDINSVLAGFGSDYDIYVPKINPSQPANLQAYVLMQSLMPSVENLDPVTSSPSQLTEESAGLAGAVAQMFFGTPVGLAAGGAEFLFNLRTMIFPDTDFRSAFTQPFETTGLSLCARNEPEKPRMRTAYLWMMKVPNSSAPAVDLSEPAYVPIGSKSELKIPMPNADNSRLLLRARKWQLIASSKEHADVPVKVHVDEKSDALDMDLTQVKLPPGQYKLAAMWDWQPMQVTGAVDLRPLGDMSKARLTAESADKLITGSGTVPVELTGTDFEFVESISAAKAGEKKDSAKPLTFTLPKGRALGDQESLVVNIDTGVEPGAYRLILTQTNGQSSDVKFEIHPPNPTLGALPVKINTGEAEQTVVLSGTHLERITHFSTTGATWELAPVKGDARDLRERKATVKIQPALHPGAVLPATISVQDIESPLEIAGAVEVVGARPRIAGVSLSLSQQPGVHLTEGEIPTGAPISFSLLTRNAAANPALTLNCSNDGYTKTTLVLHPGDRSATAQLDFAGDDGLFLSVDPGAIGISGCQLAATITTQDAGSSDATTLGRVIRLPRIEKFALDEDKLTGNLYSGTLTGFDLQTIDKTGWDAKTGFAVQGIPTPVPGGNPGEQTLKIELSWPPPSPHAPIYVWLRGEATGRLTDVKY